MAEKIILLISVVTVIVPQTIGISYQEIYNRLNFPKQPLKISPEEKISFVRKQNYIRRNVKPSASDMELLIWDSSLEEAAQTIGCTWGDSMPKLGVLFPYVIMAAHHSTNYPSSINILAALNTWLDEGQYYNYETGHCISGNCTYYLQIISRVSFRVGCAVMKCGNTVKGRTSLYKYNDLVHCVYSFPLVDGKPYTAGEPCSLCLSWQICVNNLCTDKPRREALKWNANGYPEKNMTISSQDRKTIIQFHNVIRRQVLPTATDMKLMTWDEEFAHFASDSTYNCDWSGDFPIFNHSKFGKDWGRSSELELSTTQYYDVRKMLQSWLSKKKLFSPRSGDCLPGKECNPYKQMISSQTYKIGCGISQCLREFVSSSDVVIIFRCYYGPKGNLPKGKSAYNQGSSCSACSGYKYCVNNLCTDEKQNDAIRLSTNGKTRQNIKLTLDQEKTVTQKLNEIRKEVQPSASDMMLITWDEELAKFASRYNCDWGGDLPEFDHFVYGKGWGRLSNMQIGYNVRPDSIKVTLAKWLKNKDLYNTEIRDCYPSRNCSKYLQMISSEAYTIGCGISKCDNVRYGGSFRSAVITRCYLGPKRYSGLGNQTYLMGQPCSQCPSDANNCYHGLCTNLTNKEARFWFKSGSKTLSYQLYALLLSLLMYYTYSM